MIKSVIFFIFAILVLAFFAKIKNWFVTKENKSKTNLICSRCKRVKSPYKECNCKV